ncbi:MAG TPA: pepsin-like aspartic protease [Bryobacteraceae bacterium]|nr:pepsin-like aspartic protease [Bryobacteraceae bacterium]
MPKIVRIPITNFYAGGDYTGRLCFGPDQKALNVLLDTGSSALALDGTKYQPQLTRGDKSTDLAQTDAYGDGSSWTGAVFEMSIVAGEGSSAVTLNGGNASIAYQASSDMFGQTDGILGLAYAPLDDAFTMPQDTWAHKYTSNQVRTGKGGAIVPYLTQLTDADVVSDKISFLTRRSFIHVGAGGVNDPLNNGWMVIGGGEESTDLYTGAFQTVKVLSDDWYSTNLKSIIVGNTDPIVARIQGPKGMRTNSIVDSGTNSLNLSPQLLKAVVSKFTPAQQELLNKAIPGDSVDANSLNLANWPNITFVLQGDSGDASLTVPPSDYWQVDTEQVGAAAVALTEGEAGLAILGLPLMNPYFTIFDGEADGGKGVIKFATRKD